MKFFLFLSEILAGCAFFSHYHAQNNLSFLRSTKVIAIKKMVSCKKFPTLGLKFCDRQKKSALSSEKAIDVVYLEIAPRTFFETYKRGLKLFCAALTVMIPFVLAIPFTLRILRKILCALFLRK